MLRNLPERNVDVRSYTRRSFVLRVSITYKMPGKSLCESTNCGVLKDWGDSADSSRAQHNGRYKRMYGDFTRSYNKTFY